MRWGIRAVIGVSFAEIFFGNCLALGLPCATAAAERILEIQQAVIAGPEREWCLDLEAMTLATSADGWPVTFEEGPRQMLLSGRWDATSQLLARDDDLTDLMRKLPYLNGFRPAEVV